MSTVNKKDAYRFNRLKWNCNYIDDLAEILIVERSLLALKHLPPSFY